MYCLQMAFFLDRSEVLSKGVDRLLEQVLVEKSTSFYQEIENLVEEHLINTGHYTRYDKPHKSEAPPRSDLIKLSDKEVEDIIKEETNKLLEASSDEKSQESDRGSYLDTPPPGTSGEVIEVETLITTSDDREVKKTTEDFHSNAEAVVGVASELRKGKPSVEFDDTSLKDKLQENNQVDQVEAKAFQNVNAILQTGPSCAHQAREPNSVDICQAGPKSGDPEVLTESNETRTSTDINLSPGSEGMNVVDECSSGSISKSGLQVKTNDTVMTTVSFTYHKPSLEINQIGGEGSVQPSTAKQIDLPKKSTLKVDLPGIKTESDRLQSNPDGLVGPVGHTLSEIRKDDVLKTTVDGTAPNKPSVQEPVYEAVKLGGTLGVVKIVKPKVGQLKGADKARKPEGEKSSYKAECCKQEARILKVDKRPDEKVKTKADKQVSKHGSERYVKSAVEKQTLTPEFAFESEGTKGISGDQSQHDKCNSGFSAGDVGELSDSDITVSSVHTSDLSSLEDSMSDMEYEDYQELVLKKNKKSECGKDDSNQSGAGANVEIRSDVRSKDDIHDKCDPNIEQKSGAKKSIECASGTSGDNKSGVPLQEVLREENVQRKSDYSRDGNNEKVNEEFDAAVFKKIDLADKAVKKKSGDFGPCKSMKDGDGPCPDATVVDTLQDKRNDLNVSRSSAGASTESIHIQEKSCAVHATMKCAREDTSHESSAATSNDADQCYVKEASQDRALDESIPDISSKINIHVKGRKEKSTLETGEQVVKENTSHGCGADVSNVIDNESNDAIINKADDKNRADEYVAVVTMEVDNGAKRYQDMSSEFGAADSKGVDVESNAIRTITENVNRSSGGVFDESGAVFTEKDDDGGKVIEDISNGTGALADEGAAVVIKKVDIKDQVGTDGEIDGATVENGGDSGEVTSKKIQSEGMKNDAFDSGTAREENESNIERTGSTRSNNPSENEEKPPVPTLRAYFQSEDKPRSKGEEKTKLKSPVVEDSTFFKPIDPAEVSQRVSPETETPQQSEQAFPQPTDDASDADNETTIEDSDIGKVKLGTVNFVI